MITMMKNWTGKVQINDKIYNSISEVNIDNLTNDIHIVLLSSKNANMGQSDNHISVSESEVEEEITVKAYMTKEATPEFDFMAKWNDNNPMPLRVMQGKQIKETRGMVYMELHGVARPTINCYCCGKELTNPVSRHYGIGPICLGKLGITRDIEDVENIREELVDVKWNGWIIKSAILNKKEIKGE